MYTENLCQSSWNMISVLFFTNEHTYPILMNTKDILLILLKKGEPYLHQLFFGLHALGIIMDVDDFHESESPMYSQKYSDGKISRWELVVQC